MGIIKEDMHEKKIKQNDNPVVSGRSGSILRLLGFRVCS